jgi:peptidoglycan DL-endopeptidase CwlO
MSYKTITNTKTSKKLSTKYTGRRIGLLLTLGVVMSGLAASPLVYADKYQDQINDLNQQNATKQDGLNSLGSEAVNLQDAISKLQAEISNLQAQIAANEVQRTATIAKIADAETQLAHNKQMLSDILKNMYVSDGMSSLEMLATSKNLNDFVDQEQYNNSIQSQIQTTLAKIKDIQAQLATQKSNLERMIADQKDMQAQVASQQAEQTRLLGLNQAQQAELDSQIKDNSSKITDLRKQQALENARLSGGKIPTGIPGGGGYPGVWAFAPMDTKLDSWGMYNRECVSWTAYKVAASGRYMPYWGGAGNANQWDDDARAAGIPVDGNPKPGDVAISNAGSYGHAMYVEDVAADGSIFISDYNQQYDGLYRAYWISASTVSAKNLVFVHF